MIGGHLYPDTMTIKSQTQTVDYRGVPTRADGDPQDDITVPCAVQELSRGEAIEQGQEQETRRVQVYCPDRHDGAVVSVSVGNEVTLTQNGDDLGRWQITDAGHRSVGFGGFLNIQAKRKGIYP